MSEIQEATAARFADTWPSVERRLLRLLRTHGVSHARAQDCVQEAATRALDARIWYDDADDLYRWAAVVVRRLAVDAWRREQHLTDDAGLADRPADVDVAHEVELRLALDAV